MVLCVMILVGIKREFQRSEFKFYPTENIKYFYQLINPACSLLDTRVEGCRSGSTVFYARSPDRWATSDPATIWRCSRTSGQRRCTQRKCCTYSISKIFLVPLLKGIPAFFLLSPIIYYIIWWAAIPAVASRPAVQSACGRSSGRNEPHERGRGGWASDAPWCRPIGRWRSRRGGHDARRRRLRARTRGGPSSATAHKQLCGRRRARMRHETGCGGWGRH